MCIPVFDLCNDINMLRPQSSTETTKRLFCSILYPSFLIVARGRLSGIFDCSPSISPTLAYWLPLRIVRRQKQSVSLVGYGSMGS
jgi:hypothetical protein